MVKVRLLSRLNQTSLTKSPIVSERSNNVLLPVGTCGAQDFDRGRLPQDAA
jgi:hypothetical protein